MMETKRRREQRSMLPVHPDAAAIDIGATVHVAAVGPARDPEPVRSFGTFTGDLHRLADWFAQCGIKTVVMESTGVYWIPIYEILEQRGFEVRVELFLRDDRHPRNDRSPDGLALLALERDRLVVPVDRVADRAETELLELADDLLGLDLGPLCSHRHDFRDASSHLNIFQQTRTGLLCSVLALALGILSKATNSYQQDAPAPRLF